MMDSESKGIQIRKLQDITKISKENTLVIGDGANDISMFREAGCAVSFCGKPVVQEASTHQIHEKDLTKVLDIVDSLVN